jgi:hypothetical protein
MRVTERILAPFVQGDKLLNVIEGGRRGRLALPVMMVVAMLTAAGTSAPASGALFKRGRAGEILHRHGFT